MDDDPAWLEVISSFDAYGSTEELLDALLNGLPTEEGRSRTNGLNERVVSPRVASARHAKTPPSSLPSSDSETLSIAAPPKKRKRLNKSRPKHEIERLQQSVRELEAMLELLNQRRGTGMNLIQNGDDDQHTNGYGVWKGVASRQFRYLRESQLENERLRSQVQTQLSIIKQLGRLVQRAQVGAPTTTVYPTLVPPAGSTMIAARRQRLLATTDAMYRRLDQVLAHEKLSPSRVECDFRESEVLRFGKNVIPPGSTLVHTWTGLLVPLPVAEVADIVWTTDANKTLDANVYRPEYEEISSDIAFSVHSIQFPMPHGVARFRGAHIRRRHIDSSRSIVIAAGSLWPLAGTPAPMHIVDFEVRTWTVTEASVSDCLEPSVVAQVLAKLESGRSEQSTMPVALNFEEASVLYSFMEKGHTFLLDHLQRTIDSRLISRIDDI